MTSFEKTVQSLERGTVVVLGIPLDENSSYLIGSALAPARIIEALHCDSTNMSTEACVDLGTAHGWTELGDLELPLGDGAISEIERSVSKLLRSGLRVLSLGGDHSITYPLVRAYAKAYKGLTILQFDAHPDTYDDFQGNPHSHASPFARIMEDDLGVRLVQVGIRTMNPHQRDQANRFGIEALEMKNWPDTKLPKLKGPLYVSLDMDALDPAFAPGVSHHEPGGLTTREAINIIHMLPRPLVGADIVELNPTRDPTGVTAMVAAKFAKELVGLMLPEPARASRKP